MPAYSTGVVTNTRDFGTAATNIVVNTSNIDTDTVTVIVKIIASVDSDVFYTAYLASFEVAPGGYEVITYIISGNVAYEVQLDVTNTTGPNTPALVSVYGIDEFGNLVVSQGFPPANLSIISGITT